MNEQGALAGMRVLDFSWALAGPFATMQLADLGAEVVKVEHPGLNEKQRGLGPYYEGFSTFFFAVNRAKRSVCIDLSQPAGRVVAQQLASQADVVVSNFRPGTMERLGLGYDDVARQNPGVIYAALSGFGQDGPYRDLPGVDAVAQALGGTMSLNGYSDGPPLRIGISIGDTIAGLYLAVAILAALQARNVTGRGQSIDVSLLEAQVALCDSEIVRHAAFGENPTRQGSRHALMAPFGPFPTSNGFIVVANVKDWALFCGLIGRDALATDLRFGTNGQRVANVDELERELAETFMHESTEHWTEALAPSGVCAVSRVNSIADLFTDPQLGFRQTLMDVPLPYGIQGSLPLPRSPMRLSATPAVRGRPMPGHGEHTQEVLGAWLGLDSAHLRELREQAIVK